MAKSMKMNGMSGNPTKMGGGPMPKGGSGMNMSKPKNFTGHMGTRPKSPTECSGHKKL